MVSGQGEERLELLATATNFLPMNYTGDQTNAHGIKSLASRMPLYQLQEYTRVQMYFSLLSENDCLQKRFE